MGLKEAVLKSLEEIDRPVTHRTITDYIIDHKYYDFQGVKIPEASVSSVLGDFIRFGDMRIERIKTEYQSYLYQFKSNNNYDL